PGENPYLTEFTERTKAPAVAAKGGPETMYPEYQEQLKRGAAVSRAEAPRASQAKNPDTGALEVLRVQGNVYLIGGGGANVTVQVGLSGSIMVDSKAGPLTDKVLAEIKKISLSNKPPQYLLITSADPDHIGGNEAIGKALGSANTWTIINTPGGSQTAVKMLAHDNVASRMSNLP